MIGTQILNYQIKSLLGDGGMGTVYLAEHVKLGRKVAIKILHSHLASNESIRNRFINEAKTMSELEHPNIVSLLDYHEDEFGLYLIMEYIDGTPLDEYIQKVSGPIPEQTAIPLLKQALSAFQYAHNKKVVHRDIKPSNLIITKDLKLKVLDFGIAKLIGNDNYKLTKTGAHTGTVYYMSPEQVRGLDVDARSDIYSLGVTMYQMLTGYNPYIDLTTEYDIFERIVKVPLGDPRTKYPAVSEHMCKVIDKATQKNPDSRFSDCEEFSKSLDSASSSLLNITGSDSKPISDSGIINKPSPVAPKKSNTALLILIPVIILFLLAGAGFGAWHFFIKDRIGKNDEKDQVTNDSSSVVKKDTSKTAKIEEKKEEPKKTDEAKTNSNDNTNTPPAPPNPQNNGEIKLVVSGSSLDDLRAKLKVQSNKYMSGKGYRPENAFFNPATRRFSCNLVPDPNTNFTKIVLVYGPLNTGCESCANTLNKNYGSEILVNTSDASYIYNVISIAE